MTVAHRPEPTPTPLAIRWTGTPRGRPAAWSPLGPRLAIGLLPIGLLPIGLLAMGLLATGLGGCAAASGSTEPRLSARQQEARPTACVTSFDCPGIEVCGTGGLCEVGTATLVPVAAAGLPPLAPALDEEAAASYFSALQTVALTMLDEIGQQVSEDRAYFETCARYAPGDSPACDNELAQKVALMQGALEVRTRFESLAYDDGRSVLSRRTAADAAAATAMNQIRATLCSDSAFEHKRRQIVSHLAPLSPWVPCGLSVPGGPTCSGQGTPTVPPNFGIGGVVVHQNGTRLVAGSGDELVAADGFWVTDRRHTYLDIAEIQAAISAVQGSGTTCDVPDSVARGRLLSVGRAVTAESASVRELWLAAHTVEPLLANERIANLIGRGSLSVETLHGELPAVLGEQFAAIEETRQRVAGLSYGSAWAIDNHTDISKLRLLSAVRSRTLSERPEFETVDWALENAVGWDDILDTVREWLRAGTLVASGAALLIGGPPAAATVAEIGALAILPVSLATAVRDGLRASALADYHAGGLADAVTYRQGEARARTSLIAASLDTVAALIGVRRLALRFNAEAELLEAAQASAAGVGAGTSEVRTFFAAEAEVLGSADEIREFAEVNAVFDPFDPWGTYGDDVPVVFEEFALEPDASLRARYGPVVESAYAQPTPRLWSPSSGDARTYMLSDILQPAGITGQTRMDAAAISWIEGRETMWLADNSTTGVLRIGARSSVTTMNGELMIGHVHPVFAPPRYARHLSIALWKREGQLILSPFPVGDVNGILGQGQRATELITLHASDNGAGFARLYDYVLPPMGSTVRVQITHVDGLAVRPFWADAILETR